MYITITTYKIYLKNKEVVDLDKESIGITCVILSFLVSIKLLLNKRLKVKRKTANAKGAQCRFQPSGTDWAQSQSPADPQGLTKEAAVLLFLQDLSHLVVCSNKEGPGPSGTQVLSNPVTVAGCQA